LASLNEFGYSPSFLSKAKKKLLVQTPVCPPEKIQEIPNK
jgi:hypothetical protein